MEWVEDKFLDGGLGVCLRVFLGVCLRVFLGMGATKEPSHECFLRIHQMKNRSLRIHQMESKENQKKKRPQEHRRCCVS